MAHSALNSNVRTPSSSLCPPFAGIPCSRTVFGTRCSLLLALECEIGSPSSPPQPCSLNPDQAPSVISHPPVKESHFSEHPLRSLAMVRHCMRSRHGGSRGGRARSQAPQSVEQPPLPASPPSYRANSPPSSPSRRPFPHNAFQSTHFKFQSNLNRPIITANITIIFFEEEAQPHAPVCISAELSQGARRIASRHGSVQNLGEEGKADERGDQHEGDIPNDTRPPGGSSHGATVAMDITGSASGTRPTMVTPRGSGAGDVARDGEIWYGNACPVVEEPLDPDIPM